MIDKNWRAFLSGKEIIFVKTIIQETFEAFFKFAKEKNLFEGDPYQVKVLKLAYLLEIFREYSLYILRVLIFNIFTLDQVKSKQFKLQ